MRHLRCLLAAAVFLTVSSSAMAADHDDAFYGGMAEGVGREEVAISCQDCHSLRMVTQQGLNRHRWDGIEDPGAAMAAILDARDEALEEAEATPGDYFSVRVYSTISTLTREAIPVPRSLFNGPRDQYWAMNGTGELELVHGSLEADPSVGQ